MRELVVRASPGILTDQVGQIEAIDNLNDKPCQMTLIQSIFHRRRHQIVCLAV